MSRSLYFDVIPSDALLLIVRYLARHPHAPLWLTSVKGSDALTVLESGGTLRAAAHEMFTSVMTSCPGHNTSSGNSLFVRQPILYNKLISALAIHLKHFQFPVTERLYCNQFRQLRVLKVRPEIDSTNIDLVLGVCGDSLRELDLMKWNLEKDLIESIALNCRKLTKLRLVTGTSGKCLQPLWSTLSATLREVACSIPSREYVEIARYCTKLDKLELLDFHENWTANLEAFAFLLQPCVLVLHFDTMELDTELYPFTTDRINAMFDQFSSRITIHTRVLFANYDQCVSFLHANGSTLRVLSLYCDERELSSEVSQSLVNVEQLALYRALRGDIHSFVRSLFIKSLPNLRRIVVHAVVNGPVLLSILARSVSTLLDLECYNLAPQHIGGAATVPIRALDFDQLLQANKHLRRIKIRVQNYRNYPEKGRGMVREIACLIRRLRECLSVEELHVTDYGISGGYRELHDACVPLRSRRMSVIVNGRRLLPVYSKCGSAS